MNIFDPTLQFARLQARLLVRHDDERGDVPGWVLVTVMTAGLCGALLKFAKPELEKILNEALNSVSL